MNPSEPDRGEERDAALIDRLYGDDPPAADDDLGELRSVRALVARVREEAPVAEPAPSISARLLQAARERAPKEGLWARFRAFMMPITAHPGLAAAATLVVVAGAAALWMRDGGKVAEPTRGPSQEVKREAAAEAVPVEEAESFETGGVIAEPPAETPAPEPTVADPAPTRPKRKVPPPAGEREREEKPQLAEGKKDEAPTVTVTGKVDGHVGGSGKGAGNEADKKKAPRKEPPPEPAAPTPPPVSPGSDDAGDAPEEAQVIATDQEAPSSADRARAVTRKARVEAEKNNCKNTMSYGTEVKNLDKRVYDRDFVRDRAIDACLRRETKKKSSQ